MIALVLQHRSLFFIAWVDCSGRVRDILQLIRIGICPAYEFYLGCLRGKCQYTCVSVGNPTPERMVKIGLYVPVIKSFCLGQAILNIAYLHEQRIYIDLNLFNIIRKPIRSKKINSTSW